MAASRVAGAQGRDYSAPDKTVTSRQALRRLRPAGERARLQHDRHVRGSGCGTSICRRSRPRSTPARTRSCARSTRSTASPGCANPYTETDILKGEWGFDGFIESDYTAVAELRACPGVNPTGGAVRARRRRRRARGRGAGAQRRHRLRDGLDQLPRLRRAAGRQPRGLDEAHRRRRAPDPAHQVPRRAVRAPVRQRRRRRRSKQLLPENRAAARVAAGRSVVLLKNEGNVLPISPSKTTALIGPLGDSGARHARPVVGPRRRQRRRLAVRRHEGAEPEHDVHAGLHDQPQRSRRPGQRVRDRRHRRRRSPRRRPPTRSSSRSARRARWAARPRRARTSTCPASSRS